MDTKPPLPPFTRETAALKTRLAEDAWNSRDPARVALVYTADTRWRNRVEFPVGRQQVVELLQRALVVVVRRLLPLPVSARVLINRSDALR